MRVIYNAGTEATGACAFRFRFIHSEAAAVHSFLGQSGGIQTSEALLAEVYEQDGPSILHDVRELKYNDASATNIKLQKVH